MRRQLLGWAMVAILTTGVRADVGPYTNLGTALDLADVVADSLVQSGAVDLNRIRFVRLVDIPGNGHFRDSLGNGIVDAWPTTGTGGLDLDAVGARYPVPEPSTLALIGLAAAAGRLGRWRPRRAPAGTPPSSPSGRPNKLK